MDNINSFLPTITNLHNGTINILNNVQNGTVSVFNQLYDSASSSVSDVYSAISATDESSKVSSDIRVDETLYDFSTTYLKEYQVADFREILNSSQNSKVLVIEKEIADPFFRCMISSTKIKKDLNVEDIYYLNNFKVDKKNCHYIYLTRSSHKNFSDFKKSFICNKDDNNFHAFYYVPSRCYDWMYQENIPYMGNFNCTLFPMSDDLISMEYPKALQRLNLEFDKTPLYDIVSAIKRLVAVYGFIPNIQAEGELSKELELLLKDLEKPSDPIMFPAFSRLTIIDRSLDYITPCLKPTTFEGLIDEILGINCNLTQIQKEDIHPSVLNFLHTPKETNPLTKVDVPLRENTVYAGLKDVNIEALKPCFKNLRIIQDETSELARVLSSSRIEKYMTQATILIKQNNKNTKETTVVEDILIRLHKTFHMQDFKSMLELERNILSHAISIDETLVFIQNLVIAKKPLKEVLRALILLCQVRVRLKDSIFSDICRDLKKQYGSDSLLVFKKLDQLGLFNSANFKEKRKKLNLFEDFDVMEPKSIAHTYGGYAPLSCRIVQKLLKNPLTTDAKGKELVLFIGGCTLAEVSACRLMSKNIVVLTTSIINSNTFLDPFL